MPNKVLKSYSERSGRSMEEVEAAWEKAKEQADKKFPPEERDSDEYWSYVNVTCMMMLGIKTPKKKRTHESKK